MNNSLKNILEIHTKKSLTSLKGVKKAGSAWNLIASKTERKHTQGIFIKEEKEGSPTLIVYIDSSALLQDYQTNHLLYEQKLCNIGFSVKKVIFKLSNKVGNKNTPEQKHIKTKKSQGKEVILSTKEKEKIQKIAKKLPSGLKENFIKALTSLYKQEKCEKHNI